MPIQIEIQDQHVKDLIDFYASKQKALRAQVAELESEIKSISATISQLKQTGKKTPFTFSDGTLKIEETNVYYEGWSWVKKIAFAINKAGKPLTTNEIAEVLGAYESPEKIKISSISATLSQKSGTYEEKLEFIRSTNSKGELIFDVWKPDFQNDINSLFGTNTKTDDLPF